MYTNNTLQPIQDNAPYTDSEGVKYPRNFPKSEIAELHLVTECECPPDTETQITTGFHIDDAYLQVWDTRLRTQEEIDAYIVKLWEDVKSLQEQMFSVNTEIAWRVERYRTQDALDGQTTTETLLKYQELLQYAQNIRNADGTTYLTPQEALDALNALTVPTI